MQKKDFMIALPIMLLVIFVVLAVYISWHFPFSVGDERGQLTSCYHEMTTGTFRFAMSAPLICIGMPQLLLFDAPNITAQTFSGANSLDDAIAAFYSVAWKDMAKLVFVSRFFSILISVLTGLIVFFWSKKLYGFLAGTFSLFLYVFDSSILAHSSVFYHDILFAFTTLLTLYAFKKFLEKPNAKTTVICGAALFLALYSKFTAVLLVVILPILLFIFSRQQRKVSLRKYLYCLAGIYLVALVLLNAGYGFEGSFSPLSGVKNYVDNKELYASIESKIPGPVRLIYDYVPIPLPPSYVKGVLFFPLYDAPLVKTFFMGQYGSKFLSFYIVSFLFKASIPFIIFILAAVLLMIKNRNRKKELYDALYLFIPIVILLLALTFFVKQLGIRYALGLYPLLCIFCGSLISKANKRLFTKKRWILAVFAVLCIWHAYSAIAILPNNLSYFNEAVGGPENGYKYFLDSNIDWGQNLGDLLAYLQNNKPNATVAYWGINDINKYVHYPDITPECKPQLAIISVNNLYKDEYKWLLDYEPAGRLGYSIHIYNITSCK